MQIAFLLYDRFTMLDAIGPYQVLAAVPGNEPIWVAERPGQIADESRTATMVAERSLEEVPKPDILVVPGGFGTRALLDHEPVLGWIRSVHEATAWTTSVCTGSLLLAAAGLLDGVPAATHWLARDQLEQLGARPVAERVVEQGKVITAAGVSSGIDMALALVARTHGEEMARAVQLGIEYDPAPPFDSGSPEKADPQTVELVSATFAAQGA